MKIPIIISSIIISLLLTSCSIDWNNEKEKRITTLEKQIQENNFNRKQECIKLESEMRNQLESYERYSDRMKGTTLYLSQIFYSPIKESCIYKSEFIFGNSKNKTYLLELNDYFTKEVIYEKTCIYNYEDRNNNFSLCSDSFAKKLNEIKGE